MSGYNGYRNWNHWNVSLWINNDESLYREMHHFIRYGRTKDKAARLMADWFADNDVKETPDGARYTVTAIRAAMVGI